MRNTSRLKSMIAGVTAAIAVSSAVPMAHAALCGDSDNSGAVAVNDAVQHLLVVNGGNPATLCGGAGYTDCADLNGDGTGPNIADTQLLLNKVSSIANCSADSCVTRTTMANGATLPKPITGNVFVAPGNTVHVNGLTFVQPGASLTIGAGATVLGDVTDPPSVIVAKPSVLSPPAASGRVFSQGTLASPVTMTSGAGAGTRDRKDWGGIVLLGSAPVNLSDPHVEGIPESSDTIYGGDNGNDFSGCLKFTRVQFSGRELTPDNELNTITLAGVGRKTVLDHIQAHRGQDDCIEWFGGTANASFTVSSAPGDDGLDNQLGTQDAVQPGLIMQGADTNETAGSNGFEEDDSEFNFTGTPNNFPKNCNITAFGARYDLASNPGTTNQVGILSRRGNSSMILNSIVKDFRQAGFQLRDPETSQHYCTTRSGGKRCVNGPNDGAACAQTAPPYTDCNAPLICLAGANAGTVCTVSSECPTSSCARDPDVVCTDAHMAGVCEGGSNAGNDCAVNADCPGGSCPITGSLAPLAKIQGVIFSNNAVPAADNSSCATNNSPAATPIPCQCSSTEYYALCKHEGNCITDTTVLSSIGGSSFPRTSLVPAGAAATLVTTAKRVDCSTKDSFFVNLPYIGGFDPAASDWTSGWTAYPTN
jgi:hypothetical protein